MSHRFGLGENSWQTLEREGRAPKGDVLAQLVEMGFSADWLLTGAGQMRRDAPAGPIDERLLAEALHLVDEWLDANGRTMTAAKRAEVAASIYAMAVEDAGGARPAVSPGRVAQILRLVA